MEIVDLILGVIVVALVYTVFSLHNHIRKSLKIQKYGRAIFTISSNEFVNGRKGHKKSLVAVSPIKEGDYIYISLKDVAKVMDSCRVYEDSDHKLIVKYFGNKIKVNNNNEVLYKRNDTFQKNIRDYKVKDDEVLLPVNIIKEVFRVKIQINNEKITIY